MKTQESAENYLETIYVLSQKKGNVKSIDIVHELGYSKPSVSVAMKNLKQKELITIDNDGYISLTPKGNDIATKIYERHIVISTLLTKLGVSSDTAAQDACKIEHIISDETFNAIKNYIEF